MKQRKGRLEFASPEVKEARRIEEIKSLGYAERLDRLFALLEASRLLREGKIVNKS
ncbi:hypothetical protein [Pararhodonellum marinum]|uniref:hypothetical protein n=1 Tax=Pararhodonellum marinum TaxID=2755358 RepID=UPI0018907D62|nr:hypothetical protein [Pararhodonellum marinum]